MACRSWTCILLSAAPVTVVVGEAVGVATFHAAASHPHGEDFVVVVVSIGALRVRGAAIRPDRDKDMELAINACLGHESL